MGRWERFVLEGVLEDDVVGCWSSKVDPGIYTGGISGMVRSLMRRSGVRSKKTSGSFPTSLSPVRLAILLARGATR